MADNLFKFTVATKANGILTKRCGKDDSGKFFKDGSECRMSRGVGVVTELSLKDLPNIIKALNHSQAIIHGIPKNNKLNIPNHNFNIESEKNFKGQQNTITRTKDDFGYPKNDNRLFMVDYDPPKDNHEKQDIESIIDSISSVLDGYKEAEKLITYSTSSCISDDNGQVMTDKGAGCHIYSVMPPNTDMERFKTIFKTRAWLKGFGLIKISKAGAMLERNLLFDEYVLSPERLDFVAGAVIPDGWTQSRPDPLYIDGGIFDPSILPDRTTEEIDQYKASVKAEKERVKPEADKIKALWITVKGKELFEKRKQKDPSDNITIKQCETIFLKATDNGDLYSDFELYFDDMNGQPVTVAEVLKDEESLKYFDKMTLSDPLEVDAGRCKAIFYSNIGKGKEKPVIHSFVHGEHKYFLHSAKPDEPLTEEQIIDNACKIIDEALKEHSAGDFGALYLDNVLDALNSLKRLKNDLYMNYRTKIKNTKKVEITKIETAAKARNNILTFGEAGEPDKVIEYFNKKHAGVMIGGQFRILNEITDHLFHRPDISISTVPDFHNKYLNKLMPDPQKPEKIICSSKYWIEHIKRRDYDSIIFEPKIDDPKRYNLWKGFSVEPKRGDWSKMKYHIDKIICNGNEDRAQYVIAWFAHILQHPDKKHRTTIVLKGGQGTGKNTFIDNFGFLLGKHFKMVTQSSHVTGKFNSHMKDCLLLFANEALWAGDKREGGVLKSLITDDILQIEPKGIDTYTVRNHLNLILSSNSEFIVPAEIDERRFYVIEVSEEKKQDKEYFKAIHEQMNNGGREAMLYDMLNIDISGVDLDKIERNGALFNQQLLNMNSITEYWYHRLDDGYILPRKTANDGSTIRKAYPDDWSNERDINVVSQEQYEDYLDYCAGRNKKFTETPTAFGVFFTKKFKVKTYRPKIEGKQTKCRIFPNLDQCKKDFASMMKMPITELFTD